MVRTRPREISDCLFDVTGSQTLSQGCKLRTSPLALKAPIRRGRSRALCTPHEVGSLSSTPPGVLITALAGTHPEYPRASPAAQPPGSDSKPKRGKNPAAVR